MMRDVSFAEWYREARPGLVDAVVRAVGRHAVASEAVDQACEKAFARWERVQTMRSANGWVYRVAINEARRQLRREAREVDVAGFLAPPPEAPPPGGEAWLVVDDLPPRQRAAVILRHGAGLTEHEIATAMGVTRSTVSSTLASAYRRLGVTLAEPQAEEHTSDMTTTLSLAIATACDSDGCDLEFVADGSRRRATYSEAVRNAIKVRPGDLVAVDAAEIVWRWWHGTVELVDAVAGTATVRRNVTQRTTDAPRTATIDVAVPSDLAGDVSPGDRVYFGSDDSGGKVVVATAAREVVLDRVVPRLPAIAEQLDG